MLPEFYYFTIDDIFFDNFTPLCFWLSDIFDEFYYFTTDDIFFVNFSPLCFWLSDIVDEVPFCDFSNPIYLTFYFCICEGGLDNDLFIPLCDTDLFIPLCDTDLFIPLCDTDLFIPF